MEIAISIIGASFSLLALILGTYFSDKIIWLFSLIGKKYLTGIYRSHWVYLDEESGQEITIQDFIDLRQRGNQLKGSVFFTFDKYKKFYIKGKIKNSSIYGQWKNPERNYSGFFLWRVQATRTIDGGWLGPNRKNKIQSGTWELQITKPRSNKSDLSKAHFNKRLHKKALISFVSDLDKENSSTVTIDDLTLHIVKGVFSPKKGHISISFYEDVLKKQSPKKVLDVGCGCGLYALYFARKGCNSMGVDFSEAAITCAQHNSAKNGIHNVKFIYSDLYDNIDQNMKFDLICSNLPFTRKERCKTVRSSLYYKSICQNNESLKRFIFEGEKRLTNDGKILFTFGTSGDLDFLNLCVSLTNLQLSTEKILEFREYGETFFVFKLSR